ncbi:MAG: methyltransferase [Clostridia bacterium]|nr:methyltransferase [Clostridia bacterium]
MERIDDLQYKGLRLIQDTERFRFTTDSVLLAGYARVRGAERVIDIGSGTGVMSFLINARTGAHVTGIELQEETYAMSVRSAELNGTPDVRFCNMDLRDAPAYFGDGAFDVAVCNPPYYNGSVHCKLSENTVSRHLVQCGIEDVCACAKRLLHEGGRLYMVFPAARLFELSYVLTQQRFNIKRARTVHHRAGVSPHIALIEAQRGAAFSAVWEPPLVLCEEDGSYTAEAARIYHLE